MEYCKYGDVEKYIKKRGKPSPCNCRILLFQMAFSLYVASERFGVRHYDVKLLNFFLQSVTDRKDHRHNVVLRYGVGSSIFQLRMRSSEAFFVKLADYGTAVMRSDYDQPVSIEQFTTLENTPPDFLILGNAAKQGHGHDSFGLGLCMFHLFTGHCPYEEILKDVICPEDLREKLQVIWTTEEAYSVIRSVIIDSDGAKDQTLFDTLYRFLVLFGIPERQVQFGSSKENKEVWHAINSTLTPQEGTENCSEAFNKHRKKYSLSKGTTKLIADARRRLSVSTHDKIRSKTLAMLF